MWRALQRWFSDAEVKKLAEEIDAHMTKVVDLGLRGEALQRRVDNLVQRTSMRLKRAGIGHERDEEDERILAEIRARSRDNGGGFDDGPRW